MNSRECETCIKRKTMYCPNSSECLETEDKKHYQNRTMLLEENQAYKEAIKRCYTPEEIDFEIMIVKAELAAEKDINNNLHKTIDKLRVNLYETQQERDKYKDVINKAQEFIRNENYLNESEIDELSEILDSYRS